MARHRILLFLALLTAIAAVWQSFSLWNSYTNPNVKTIWTANSYHTQGYIGGDWIWEDGPQKIDFQPKIYTQVHFPLEEPYADYVKAQSTQHLVEESSTGLFTGIRIYAAEDYQAWANASWKMSLEEEALKNPLHVFAARCGTIPLQWLAPLLLCIALGLVIYASSPYHRTHFTLAFLSLIIAASNILLWSTSYRTSGLISDYAVAHVRESPDQDLHYTGIGLSHGNVILQSMHMWGVGFGWPGWRFGDGTALKSVTGSGLTDFACEAITSGDPHSGANGWNIRFPIWLPLFLTLIYPCIVIPRIIKTIRYKPHHCPSCGYDLRASPNRCPECGTAVNKSAIQNV